MALWGNIAKMLAAIGDVHIEGTCAVSDYHEWLQVLYGCCRRKTVLTRTMLMLVKETRLRAELVLQEDTRSTSSLKQVEE